MPAKKIISPILLAPGDRRCCQPAYNGITSTLVVANGFVGEDNNLWNSPYGHTIYTCTDVAYDGDPVDGSVTYGICCAESVTLHLTGHMRILSPGEDGITVELNGNIEYQKSADTTEGQAWYDATYGGSTSDPHLCYPFEYDLTLTLESRACGNIVKIYGSSDETVHGIGAPQWSALITALPPIVP